MIRFILKGVCKHEGWEDNNGRKHFRTEVVAHEVIALSTG